MAYVPGIAERASQNSISTNERRRRFEKSSTLAAIQSTWKFDRRHLIGCGSLGDDKCREGQLSRWASACCLSPQRPQWRRRVRGPVPLISKPIVRILNQAVVALQHVSKNTSV